MNRLEAYYVQHTFGHILGPVVILQVCVGSKYDVLRGKTQKKTINMKNKTKKFTGMSHCRVFILATRVSVCLLVIIVSWPLFLLGLVFVFACTILFMDTSNCTLSSIPLGTIQDQCNSFRLPPCSGHPRG